MAGAFGNNDRANVTYLFDQYTLSPAAMAIKQADVRIIIFSFSTTQHSRDPKPAAGRYDDNPKSVLMWNLICQVISMQRVACQQWQWNHRFPILR